MEIQWLGTCETRSGLDRNFNWIIVQIRAGWFFGENRSWHIPISRSTTRGRVKTLENVRDSGLHFQSRNRILNPLDLGDLPKMKQEWRLGRNRWPAVGLCGLPPIEQKSLDGWGAQFHPPRVGNAGGRLMSVEFSTLFQFPLWPMLVE